MSARFVLAGFLFSFVLILGATHTVFATTTPSASLTIQDNATGGDCALIGVWNNDTKTCTLTDDVAGSTAIPRYTAVIRLVGTGITLDGAGKTMTGATNMDDTALELSGARDATVKNLTVAYFYLGIKANSSENITLSHITVRNNGIDPDQTNLFLQNINGATISDSTFIAAQVYAIARSYNLQFVRNRLDHSQLRIDGTAGIALTDNAVVGADILIGDSDGCASTTIVRNTITSGNIGFGSSGPNLIADNTVEGSISGRAETMMIARNHVRKPTDNDGYYGISVRGTGFTLVDNEVSGCTGNESRCSNYTLFGVSGGTFSHNRSEGGKIGFDVWNASGLTLTDNTVVGAREAAVSITGQDNANLPNSNPNIFTANTFRDGAVGIKAIEPYGFQISNIFSKNIFARNTSNTEVSYSNPNFVKL